MCLSPISVHASPNEDAAGEQDWHLTQDLEYQSTNCAASPCFPTKSVKQGVKVHSVMLSPEVFERLKVELENQITEGFTLDQSTEGDTESPPYSPFGSPTPSLEVLLSSAVPTVRPLDTPKSSTTSPFLATQSPSSREESIMTELMLDMIYRAKNAKKKGMVTRTLSLDDVELDSAVSPSGSERTWSSFGSVSVPTKAAKLRAAIREMLHRMSASFAGPKSSKSSRSKSSSAKRSWYLYH